MNRTLSFAFAFVNLLSLAHFSYAQKDKTAKARATYSQFCSSCHGEKVEAFVDRKWKHGTGKDEIIASITNGYADAGMPAWGASIDKKEISQLADLIVSSLKTVNAYDFKDVVKTDTYTSKGITIKMETVLEGLESPWGLVSLPDGALLVSDRAGDLWKVHTGKSKTKIEGVPRVRAEGQGGLFDITLHPKYAENGWIYLSYAKLKKEGDKSLSTTAIIRAKLKGNALVDIEEIFEALPYFATSHHYGGRMVFDDEEYLYFSVGERGHRDENPQSLENGCGKIHRINADGSIPSDNPFYNTPNAVQSIWSYGHRNPQGLIYKADTDEIWEHEHGPRGGDEMNLIEKGKNYGWPLVSYGINYDGTTFTNETERASMIQPVLYWIPSIAPCGMARVTSDKYPAWKGDILAGSLRFNYLNRCEVENDKIVGQEKTLINVGRLRNIVQAADGYLYIGIEKPGTVYRLLPQ